MPSYKNLCKNLYYIEKILSYDDMTNALKQKDSINNQLSQKTQDMNDELLVKGKTNDSSSKSGGNWQGLRMVKI